MSLQICPICRRKCFLIEVPTLSGKGIEFTLKERCPNKQDKFDGHLQLPVPFPERLAVFITQIDSSAETLTEQT